MILSERLSALQRVFLDTAPPHPILIEAPPCHD